MLNNQTEMMKNVEDIAIKVTCQLTLLDKKLFVIETSSYNWLESELKMLYDRSKENYKESELYNDSFEKYFIYLSECYLVHTDYFKNQRKKAYDRVLKEVKRNVENICNIKVNNTSDFNNIWEQVEPYILFNLKFNNDYLLDKINYIK